MWMVLILYLQVLFRSARSVVLAMWFLVKMRRKMGFLLFIQEMEQRKESILDSDAITGLFLAEQATIMDM